ncbi:MAG: metallophosphoesterase, partial [Bacteroidales bacterium]|nr:metallophosphoesterase [Bacteroidales bacterium]
MKIRLHKKILTTFLLVSFLIGSAQKIYYAPGNENWELNIPEDSTELLYTVYLLGDIKYPLPDSENLKLLKNHISNEGNQSAVIFLGDILLPLGLPDSADKSFNEAEQNLKHILNTLDSFDGKVVFLPGNHDWSQGRQQGWESVKNQEKYIEQYLDRGNVFLPDLGCPGPVEVELSQDITLIIFDSQWWLHKNIKPGLDGECGFIEEAELFIQIEDALRRNRDKKVIFAAHHP